MASEASTPGASERMERRVLHVCDATGALVEYWGFKAIMGRVWALLVLQTEPMAQSRIAETLGVSRSLVSGAIADLSSYGLVRAAGEGRNAPYAAAIDIWPAVTDTLRTREWMLLETARLALEAAIEEARVGAAGPFSLERMRLLLGMVKAVQTLLGMILALRRPNVVANAKAWVKGLVELVDSLRRVR